MRRKIPILYPDKVTGITCRGLHPRGGGAISTLFPSPVLDIPDVRIPGRRLAIVPTGLQGRPAPLPQNVSGQGKYIFRENSTVWRNTSADRLYY